VAASEVKALAEQTVEATGEIGRQIGGIQAATEESVAAIRDINDTISRLSEISIGDRSGCGRAGRRGNAGNRAQRFGRWRPATSRCAISDFRMTTSTSRRTRRVRR
jgi:hypothetical protein